jgi:D-amino peptidase
MKKFAIRSDMEGLSGVVTWDEVIPGRPPYEKSLVGLQQEINALAGGLLEAGADAVEIYDEHYYGLNIDPGHLSAGVSVVRGKPPYRPDWPGGLDASFSGMVLQGYHAMAGVADAILPHTYEPEIEAIWINGTLVGETGVETAIAGEAGVPLVLFLGDAHGAAEARALVPEVECVVVKEGMGEQKGRCLAWPDVAAAVAAATRRVVQNPRPIRPFVFPAPIEFRVQLAPGDFRRVLFETHPGLVQEGGQVVLPAASVTEAFSRYWAIKEEVQRKLAAQG